MGVRVYIACVLLFTCLHVTVFGKDCVTKDECSCTFDDDGTVIDITSLGNQDNTPRFKDVVDQAEGDRYSYNPCYPFKELDCEQAATCVLDPDLSQGVQIGDASKGAFKYDDDSGNVLVTYTSGPITDLKISEIILVCDQKACDPVFTANGQQTQGQFQMTLKHVCACPNGCDSSGPKNCSGGGHHHSDGPTTGLSTGSILVITFFAIIILYAVAGTAVMKFVKKAEGKEVVPNISFWTQIPILIKDGAMFTLGLCIPRFRRTAYDKI